MVHEAQPSAVRNQKSIRAPRTLRNQEAHPSAPALKHAILARCVLKDLVLSREL